MIPRKGSGAKSASSNSTTSTGSRPDFIASNAHVSTAIKADVNASESCDPGRNHAYARPSPTNVKIRPPKLNVSSRNWARGMREPYFATARPARARARPGPGAVLRASAAGEGTREAEPSSLIRPQDAEERPLNIACRKVQMDADADVGEVNFSGPRIGLNQNACAKVHDLLGQCIADGGELPEHVFLVIAISDLYEIVQIRLHVFDIDIGRVGND